MYTIILRPDGKYDCECRLQDSKERHKCNTLEEAIKHCIDFARICNHTIITAKEITYLQWQQVTEWRAVEWIPDLPMLTKRRKKHKATNTPAQPTKELELGLKELPKRTRENK